MSEMIKKEDVMRIINAENAVVLNNLKERSTDEVLCTIAAQINGLQTTEKSDAEPVRHGRWINDVYCSECKRFPVDVSVSISNRELTKYFSRCPHCGARMNGSAKDEDRT